jgi:para-aminobenzoate synthetase component 1
MSYARRFRDYDSAAAHFRTGFIGYFGYGLQQKLERLPPSPIDVTGMPILCGGDYVWSVVTDHAAKATDLWYDDEYEQAARAILRRLANKAPAPLDNFSIGSLFSTEMSDRQYIDAFNSIRAYLLSGECYQVNLARHYATSLHGNRCDASWAAYRRLVALQPVPFGARIVLTR